MISIIRLVACQEFLMVNDYHESHTKVRVTNLIWTITLHMNYGWGSFFQLLCYTHKGINPSRETLLTGLLFAIHSFYAYLQYIVHHRDIREYHVVMNF